MRQAGPDPMVWAMPTRITFVTIGQTPRSDLVPDLIEALPREVEIAELGALDGLGDDEIRDLEPSDDDHALVTRLADGRQAIVGKRSVTGRLVELLDEAPGATATVLLCTGEFPELDEATRDTARLGLSLDAQRLVDHGVAALCHGAGSLGLLVPLARQEGEHHLGADAGHEHHLGDAGRQRLTTAHASPYDDRSDFRIAGRALADCDAIVMHCMGYTDAQRRAVATASGRPVLLARRLVAAAIGQLF